MFKVNYFWKEDIMRVGIPKGLLYYKYHPFLNRFFTELGAEIVTSNDTNRDILDEGGKILCG